MVEARFPTRRRAVGRTVGRCTQGLIWVTIFAGALYAWGVDVRWAIVVAATSLALPIVLAALHSVRSSIRFDHQGVTQRFLFRDPASARWPSVSGVVLGSVPQHGRTITVEASDPTAHVLHANVGGGLRSWRAEEIAAIRSFAEPFDVEVTVLARGATSAGPVPDVDRGQEPRGGRLATGAVVAIVLTLSAAFAAGLGLTAVQFARRLPPDDSAEQARLQREQRQESVSEIFESLSTAREAGRSELLRRVAREDRLLPVQSCDPDAAVDEAPDRIETVVIRNAGRSDRLAYGPIFSRGVTQDRWTIADLTDDERFEPEPEQPLLLTSGTRVFMVNSTVVTGIQCD